MDIIIKNKINVFGNYEGTNLVVNKITDKKGKFSFNRLVPIEPIAEDDDMTDYICACINLYMKQNDIKDDKFINSCKFVGITRKNPYNFQVLDDEEINKYKKKYKTKKMLEDAESFLNKINSKIIFNGTMVREAKWGTISEPINFRSKNNIFYFDTFYTPALEVVKSLTPFTIDNPGTLISYTYASGKRANELIISNGEIKYRVKNELENIRLIDEIKKNVFI